jgi:hypothetical protein
MHRHAERGESRMLLKLEEALVKLHEQREQSALKSKTTLETTASIFRFPKERRFPTADERRFARRLKTAAP